MWRWLINLAFPMLAILAGVQMFVLKYQVIEKEDELKKIHRQILSDNREIHMLEADWALANDPKRLREFVQTQTQLVPIQSSQLIDVDDLPIRVAPVPGKRPSLDEVNGEEETL